MGWYLYGREIRPPNGSEAMADNNNINLLNKTFDVIELLASSGREMGVSEISRRLSMVKSGTFRILNTLKERDLVYQNPATKCYALGLKLYFIGSAAQAGLPLCTVAKKHLDALSITYEECFELSIPYEQSTSVPSCLVVCSGSAFSSARGMPNLLRPLHATSAGKCLLAFSSGSDVKSYQGFELKAFTDKTITSWETLNAELPVIRDRGFSSCKSEYENGVNGLAVPVYDSMHSLLGALSVSGTSDHMNKLSEDELVGALQRASRNIGKNF